MKKDKIKRAIEKKFLGIRGWKSWEEYDKMQESTELDKNIRWELIEIAIQETQKTSNQNNSQHPEVKACQGEGETSHPASSGLVKPLETTADEEVGNSSRNPSADNNQKQNVQAGVSHSDTLGTIRQTASSDNSHDDPGKASGADNGDTGDSTFHANLKSKGKWGRSYVRDTANKPNKNNE